MNKCSTAYAERQQEISTSKNNEATAEFLNIPLEQFYALSRHERHIAHAARQGITVTFNAETAAQASSWSLVNPNGLTAQITKNPGGGYGLECDGFEAEEAQHERDAYRKQHAMIMVALPYAIRLLS